MIRGRWVTGAKAQGLELFRSVQVLTTDQFGALSVFQVCFLFCAGFEPTLHGCAGQVSVKEV
jgi:hypothetical protein